MAILEAKGVHKRFGGVVALDGASLSCERGEVHALLGSNGSGKSTLAKVITGVVAPDAGEIKIRGKVEAPRSPADMRRLRVAAVYQDLSLIPQLTVAENILLHEEPRGRWGFIDSKALRRKAATAAEQFAEALGRSIPMDELVGNLSPSEQQTVEIIKALARNPEILILDEATASLHKGEVDALFETITKLKAKGCAILFISHRMEEIFRFCDRATVLRNGQTVGTVKLSEASEGDLVDMMVGQRMDEVRAGRGQATRGKESQEGPEKFQREGSQPVVLRIHNLRAGDGAVRDVSLELREGEVVGLGGLQGQGQSELLKAIFGALPLESGRIEINNNPVSISKPMDAIRNGIALIPGDRAREGLFPVRPVLENLNIASMHRRSAAGFLRARREEAAAGSIVSDLQIKVEDLSHPVHTLSGGNQQKVVVGRWLLNGPRILLLDDATKGVDVHAKSEIYAIIERLREQGAAVLLYSSDDLELVTLCDRVLVLYEGKIVETLSGADLTENRLVSAALRLAPSGNGSEISPGRAYDTGRDNMGRGGLHGVS